jgi:hypothetical protein
MLSVPILKAALVVNAFQVSVGTLKFLAQIQTIVVHLHLLVIEEHFASIKWEAIIVNAKQVREFYELIPMSPHPLES